MKLASGRKELSVCLRRSNMSVLPSLMAVTKHVATAGSCPDLIGLSLLLGGIIFGYNQCLPRPHGSPLASLLSGSEL